MALKADFFHDVTMFHPTRPLVKWSKVENRLASRNGGSKDVDAVIPKARFLVTAAMAEMGLKGFQHALHLVAMSRTTYNGGICHWPLSRSADAVVQAPLVGIVPSICIS